MSAATCPTAEQLHAYVVGLLPDDRSETIAEHLDQCAECQAAIATVDDADDTFVSTLRQPAADDPLLAEVECEAAVARAANLPLASTPADLLPDTRSRVGEVLGEYRLLEEIGRGGMGRVYRALQTKLDRIMALKVLPSHRNDDQRAIARFEREMRAVGRLDHPHIVHAYDAREIDGKPVLAMEYVEGRDLARILLSLGKLDVNEACELIRQTCLGLQYAHEHGLVHRDIKPSNLMLTPDGKVKILDLGLVRFEHAAPGTDEMTGAGQPMGTADYMAPEQISDSRAVDIRSDIYSLGCTLFKLLTGHAPFSGPGSGGTFDKLSSHVRQPAPSILEYTPSLPPELASLIQQMLAKAPDVRPATPVEVANFLTPFCEGCDLARLYKQALLAESQVRQAVDTHAPPPLKEAGFAPVTAASWSNHSRGPRYAALTLVMLLCVLGGFALGVIITIKRGDKQTTLQVPDGSRVAIDNQARVEVELPTEKGAAGVADAQDEMAIQGIWQVAERQGSTSRNVNSLLRAKRELQPDGNYRNLWTTSFLHIGPDRLRVVGEHELPSSFEYSINPRSSPKMIDLSGFPALPDSARLGVYELDGDELRMCLGCNNTTVRPDTVWAGMRPNQESFVLKRVSALPQPQPDLTAIMGLWYIAEALLAIPEPGLMQYRGYSAPAGRLDVGRCVMITRDELIIRGVSPALAIDGQPWEQPCAHDDSYSYALDPQRGWIGFTSIFSAPCPGLYRLQGDELLIRLGAEARPPQIDAPWGTGETILRLTRSNPEATDPAITLSPATESASNAAGGAGRPMPGTGRNGLVLFFDSLGSATAEFGVERTYLGYEFASIVTQLRALITKHDINTIMVIHSVRFDPTNTTELRDALEDAGIVSITFRVGSPPPAPAQLDFRIAATRQSAETPGLTKDETLQLTEMLQSPSAVDESAPKRKQLGQDYEWVEINEWVGGDILEDKNVIVAPRSGKHYVLLTTASDDIMSSHDPDERAWRIVHAESVDADGSPAISLVLDRVGGQRLAELTEKHIGRSLALVINGQAYMTPRILDRITSPVRISGNFTSIKTNELVDALNETSRQTNER